MAQAGNIVARLQLKVDEYKKGMADAKKELTSFSNTTKTVAKVAAAAFAAVGTAVAGVAGAAAKLALEQEEMNSKMQAATGATAAEMEKFKDIADNLFAKGRGNYEEIYSTLTQIKQVLGQTGKEAEDTADKALILSKTFGWDVTESLRAADSVQKAWGVSTTKSFDTFTALAQQAGDKSGDLLDTFNEYAPTLSDAGISLETFGDALKAGMDAGAFNFDKIGDALKEFNVRITDGSAQAFEFTNELFGSAKAADEFFKGISDGSIKGDQALKIIGEKLAKIEDPIKRNQLGVAYFGTMWEDLGGDVVLAMANADGALKNIEGSTASAGQALDDNLNTKITQIKNSFLIWAKDIGEKLLPTLNQIADWVMANMPQIQAVMTNVFNVVGGIIWGVVKALGEVIGFVVRNKEAFALLGAVIAGVVIPSLLGFLAHSIALKTKALVALIKSTVQMTIANYKLGLSYLAAYGHVLLIIAGIALLVAGIIWLIKNWDTVKEKILQVWESIKDYLSAAWDWIKEKFQAFLNWISELWSTIWEGIKAVGEAIWNGIKEAFFAVWNAIWNFISTILAVIYAIIATAWEGIKALAEWIWGYIGDFVIGIWNGIKAAAEFIWNAIKAYFTTVLNFYKTIFTTVWNAIKTVLTTVWNAISSVATTIWNGIKAFFETLLNTVKTVFTNIWNGIKNFLLPIWNSIKSAATSIFNAIKNTLTSIMNGIKSVITSIWNGIKSVLTGIWNGIKGAASSVWNGISSVISNIVNGIRSKISTAANFMKNTFSGAINAVKGFFGGLWSSIKQSLQNVVDGIKSKVQKAKEWLTELNPFKRHSPSLVDNVLAGTKIIKDTYESLGGLQIAPPQIGNLTAGRLDVEAAFGGFGEGGGNGGSTYNAPLIQVENMNVRDDQDVRNVSRELFNLQRSHDRAKGGR